MNPFLYFFYVSSAALVSAEAGDLSSTELVSAAMSAAVVLYGLYKLNAVESVIKMVLLVFMLLGGGYLVGLFMPSYREAAWYQLIAWIVEVGPRIVMEQIGGMTS